MVFGSTGIPILFTYGHMAGRGIRPLPAPAHQKHDSLMPSSTSLI